MPVLHVFKIERGADSCGERECLHREEEPRIADAGCNLGKAEDLETPFHRAGAPRPVQVKTRCPLAGFAQEAVVKGDGRPVPAPSAVENIKVSEGEGAYEYYNLQGTPLSGEPKSGVYIRRNGTVSEKILVR